ALEHLHLDATARVPIAFEHGPDLRHHGLRWKDVLAGPAGDDTELAERAHLPRRVVRDNDVRSAVRPEDGRLGIDVDDARPVAVLARQRVEDAARSWRDARPMFGCRRV